MKRMILLLSGIVCLMMAYADTFRYNFNSTPLSEALDRIAEDHPTLYLNFIYNELGNYRTSAKVNTDNPYEALRQTVGLNPVSVMQRDNRYFVEALQHGKYRYAGRAVGSGKEPIEAATVLLLSPKDSTVLTYGITDAGGRFSIPCDRTEVIAKLSCVGYKTTYRRSESFNMGNIEMEEAYVQLNRVVVEAREATAYSDRTVYRPSAQQKRAAQNATDLLRFLAIPQIKVNLIDNSVTNNTGQGVQIYVNGQEASAEELQGLPTSDVRQVEYLEFPTDPRYKGGERVINFIVQEYAYGGYTKLSAQENVLTGLASHADVFSKFTYKRMSYDVYVGANNYDNRHTGSSSESRYLLADDRVVEREEEFLKSHYERNQYPVTFRATYNSDKVQVRNTVGFSHDKVPISEYRGTVGGEETAEEFHRSNPTATNSASYSGSYYFVLPRNWAVDVTPTFSYSHINDMLTYEAGDYGRILRQARENAFTYRVNAYLRKTFNQHHSIMVGANGGDIINRLRYTGTVEYSDRFHLGFAAGVIGYNFHNRKVSVNTDAGVCWEGSNINGKRYDDVYPWTHINVQYNFSESHLISSYFQYANNSPTVSNKASDILQDNEFLYITGNPYVKNSRHITFTLAYTWLPSNKFSMTAYGTYHGIYDRLMTTYSPYDGGKAVLRNYTNNGDFHHSEIGVAGNLKLFDGMLQLYACPEQAFYRSTGIYNKTYTPFLITAQAMLYLGNIYVQAYYKSADRSMPEDAPMLTRSRDYHMIGVGWSDNHWKVALSAYNFFNRGWRSTTGITDSHYYSERKTAYSTVYHPRLNLSVTYTFNYGKKVQRNNEVGEQEGASSAILK